MFVYQDIIQQSFFSKENNFTQLKSITCKYASE